MAHPVESKTDAMRAAEPPACGLVDTLDQAQRVATRLIGLGVDPAVLSLLVSDDAEEAAATLGGSGLAAGGRVQAPGGWPGSARALAVTGLGACFAIGPLVEVLTDRTGTGLGPGLPSALRRLGLRQSDALSCEQAVRYAQVLMTLHQADPATVQLFRRSLIAFGGRPIGPSPAAQSA
jgi:hypothetical protein